MSTSSDSKNNPDEDGVEEPWFQVMVPRYIKAGDTFRVTIDDERGKFFMRVLCPTGAAGGSKMKDRSRRKMVWVPVRCPEGASGGEKIQVRLNGESKVFNTDSTSCKTSSSSSQQGLLTMIYA